MVHELTLKNRPDKSSAYHTESQKIVFFKITTFKNVLLLFTQQQRQ